jgi:hypothetical protein
MTKNTAFWLCFALLIASNVAWLVIAAQYRTELDRTSAYLELSNQIIHDDCH